MKPNRLHESTAADVLGLLQGSRRMSWQFVIVCLGAALVHAILDLAQATREGYVR